MVSLAVILSLVGQSIQCNEGTAATSSPSFHTAATGNAGKLDSSLGSSSENSIGMLPAVG
jgi:hypothetical protein